LKPNWTRATSFGFIAASSSQSIEFKTYGQWEMATPFCGWWTGVNFARADATAKLLGSVGEALHED
jgi:hypothetical protein